MRARGLSQIEIAHELQVSKQSVSSDVQYLYSQGVHQRICYRAYTGPIPGNWLETTKAM